MAGAAGVAPPDRRALGRARQRGRDRDRRLRVSEQGARLQRADRRRLPDRGRGRRGALGHGVLQRLRDRAGVRVGHQDAVLPLGDLLPTRTARVIEGAGSHGGRSVIARTLLTQPVYCQPRQAPTPMRGRDAPRRSRTSSCRSTAAASIRSPQRFPVTLRLEGTVRGTGGIRIVDDRCATAVPGPLRGGRCRHARADLRRLHRRRQPQRRLGHVVGLLGRAGAADHASQQPKRRARVRRAGRRAPGSTRTASTSSIRADVVRAVQAEVFPFERNFFRTGAVLARCRSGASTACGKTHATAAQPRARRRRAREAAAMVATARWMYRGGSQRTETRGMHKRYDHPRSIRRQRAF